MRQLLSIMLLLFWAVSSHAQVTIGSGEAPLPGAILDLKESGSTTKGLGLPRVALLAADKLKMGSAPEMATAAERAEHIGLLVYNTQKAGGLCKGIHVWSGDSWEPLIPLQTAEEKALTDPNSNTFLLKPNQRISIPVQKAYDVWANEALLDNLALTGPVTAEVYWSDTEDLVEAYLQGGDQGANSIISVYPAAICAGESFKSGNAVVAVRVNGIIRWSWHIWMTDYDPDDSGATHTYNNGTYSTTFMDRNLGALSADPTDGLLAMGNTYEWGRKDPFPHPAGRVVDGGSLGYAPEIPLYGVKTAITQQVTNADPKVNLQATITDPLMYVSRSGWLYDGIAPYANQDADFWGGVSGTKGIYDPCPEGWKVPHTVGNVSPWDGLTPSGMIAVSVPGDLINSLNFSTTVGMYPLAGGRFNGSGSSGGRYQMNFNIGQKAGYWASTSQSYNGADVLEIAFPPISIQTTNTTRKAYGLSVRCAKQ